LTLVLARGDSPELLHVVLPEAFHSGPPQLFRHRARRFPPRSVRAQSWRPTGAPCTSARS
jgi:hypothetical protein